MVFVHSHAQNKVVGELIHIRESNNFYFMFQVKVSEWVLGDRIYRKKRQKRSVVLVYCKEKMELCLWDNFLIVLIWCLTYSVAQTVLLPWNWYLCTLTMYCVSLQPCINPILWKVQKSVWVQVPSMKVSENSCMKISTVSQLYINKFVTQAFLSCFPHKVLKEPELPTSLFKKMLTPFGLVFY